MSAVISKKTAKTKGSEESGASWQSQKSAMTRDRILEAAIECFIDLGYTNVTTAKVSDFAGVSRGAMLHHFPSKAELIQAAVEFLHGKLLKDYSDKVSKIPQKLKGKERRRAGLDAYWDYLNDDLYMVYHELCVAGRTDSELKSILDASAVSFEEHVYESSKELFKEWKERGELYFMAMDLSKCLMEGMASSQLGKDRDKRVKRLMDYLGDRLEEIFTGGEDSAINQHSAKS